MVAVHEILDPCVYSNRNNSDAHENKFNHISSLCFMCHTLPTDSISKSLLHFTIYKKHKRETDVVAIRNKL